MGFTYIFLNPVLDFFKSLFYVLQTQFIHTLIQKYLLYTFSVLGPQDINWEIAENKARSSSHGRGRQQTREQINEEHNVREINGWKAVKEGENVQRPKDGNPNSK